MHTPHKHRKCSKCKKLGHNKRTCGMPTPQTFTAIKPTSPPKQGTKINPTETTSVAEGFEYVTTLHSTQSEKVNSEKDTGDINEYTAEELETLWSLQNDKNGKLGKGKSVFGENAIWTRQDSERLINFVETVENHPPGVQSETWRVFFKNLGAVAKITHLDTYKPALRVKFDYDYALDGTLPSAGNTVQDNPEYPPLPEKFFPVFTKDTSAAVRAATARRAGLPEPLMRGLARDKNIKVVYSLMLNAEVPTEIINTVEQRIQITLEPSPTGSISQELPTFQRTKNYVEELTELRKAIAANPNCPTLVAVQYSRDENLMSYPGMDVVLYANPALPEKELVSTFKKTQWEMKKSKTELDGTHGGVVLRKRIPRLRNRLNKIISTGRCPTHITEPYIDHMIRRHSFAGNDQTLGLTLSKAVLSEGMVKKLLQQSKTPHWRYIVYGLAHNEHSTRETLNWIAQNPPHRNSSWTEHLAHKTALERIHKKQ